MHFYAYVSIFFLITGCVSLPREEMASTLSCTPTLEPLVQQALTTSAFVEGNFPSKDWWELFQDPQLADLIDKALACSPTMQIAKARLEAAEARANIQKSRLLPTLGLSADINWQYMGKNSFFRAFTPVIPGNITEYEIDVNFSYELDFFGKNRNLYQAAIGEAKIALAEQESTTLILSTSVACVYFKLQTNLEKLRILKEQRKNYKELTYLTTLRQKHALNTAMQTLDIEEKLITVRKSILLAKLKIELNQHTLHALLGEGPIAYEEIEKIQQIAFSPFPLPTDVSSELLCRRPDLMAHIWKVEALAHLVGAAKADFYPRVDLFALAGLDSVFFRKLFSWPSRSASLEPAFYLPIFTGGRLTANLKTKQKEFEEAMYSYNESVLYAVKEVADAIAMLKKTEATLALEENRLQNRNQNYSLLSDRYQNALGTLLDVLEAKNLFLEQEFERTVCQYQNALAAIQLIKALGGGYCNGDLPCG